MGLWFCDIVIFRNNQLLTERIDPMLSRYKRYIAILLAMLMVLAVPANAAGLSLDAEDDVKVHTDM